MVAVSVSNNLMDFFRARGSRICTLPAMTAGLDELLDATIAHLKDLKAHGVRFVEVSAGTLRELSEAPTVFENGTRGARPSESGKPAVLIPPEIARPPNPEGKMQGMAALREKALA